MASLVCTLKRLSILGLFNEGDVCENFSRESFCAVEDAKSICYRGTVYVMSVTSPSLVLTIVVP